MPRLRNQYSKKPYQNTKTDNKIPMRDSLQPIKMTKKKCLSINNPIHKCLIMKKISD